MNSSQLIRSAASNTDSGSTSLLTSHRILRNTYALLAMTILFSAIVATVSSSMNLPHPGILLTLAGYFGLLFLTTKLRNSGWGLLSVFGLTGFMGYTLGPSINQSLQLANGAQLVGLSLGGTAVIFFALSALVLTTRRNFDFMGKFLMAGMIVAILAGLAATFMNLGALSLAVSAVVMLLMAGMILYETSRIVNDGENNYIMATVSLYVSIFNLFTSLLHLLGFTSEQE
jgi:modulator of FtsH protease